MKLYNVIMQVDVYVVAESADDARATIKKWMQTSECKPTEEVALETRFERNIRQSWRDQRPLIGDAVPDASFNKMKGKTVLDAWKMLYTNEQSVAKR